MIFFDDDIDFSFNLEAILEYRRRYVLRLASSDDGLLFLEQFVLSSSLVESLPMLSSVDVSSSSNAGNNNASLDLVHTDERLTR